MAIHLVERAALTTLPASTKLVLMAYADAADRDTRIAAPGFDNVLAWSGLKRSRATDVVGELVAAGYLLRRSSGRRGHRAEFYVFPRGCCPMHGPLPGLDLPPIAPARPVAIDADEDGSATGLPVAIDTTSATGGPVANPEIATGIGAGLDRPPPQLPSSTDVDEEGDRPARTRASAAEPDVEAPPPAAARPIPPEERARLQALGDEARRATAQARAEAASRDTTAIAGCDRCDEHGLLPSRVPCMHPKSKPPPGSGRAAFAAAKEALASRRCTGCSATPARCLEARVGCCPECSHSAELLRSADPARFAERTEQAATDVTIAGAAVLGSPPLLVPRDPSSGDGDTARPTTWSVCSTCGRAQRHLPGCPDDPANAPEEAEAPAVEEWAPEQLPPFADPEEVLAAADRIAVEDAELLARLDDEPDPVWGTDAPPF